MLLVIRPGVTERLVAMRHGQQQLVVARLTTTTVATATAAATIAAANIAATTCGQTLTTVGNNVGHLAWPGVQMEGVTGVRNDVPFNN